MINIDYYRLSVYRLTTPGLKDGGRGFGELSCFFYCIDIRKLSTKTAQWGTQGGSAACPLAKSLKLYTGVKPREKSFKTRQHES